MDINKEQELLEALLKDIYVEYSGNQEIYIINAIYNKKSKVFQLLKEYFKND